MMRSLRAAMAAHIIIEEALEALDENALKAQLPLSGCGAVVSFLGITRGTEGDAEVIRLEFDAWQEQLSSVLHGLAEEAIEVHKVRCESFGNVMPWPDFLPGVFRGKVLSTMYSATES